MPREIVWASVVGSEMWYSPEADLIAGGVMGAVGVTALRHADDNRDLLVAGIPAVLATHQLIVRSPGGVSRGV